MDRLRVQHKMSIYAATHPDGYGFIEWINILKEYHLPRTEAQIEILDAELREVGHNVFTRQPTEPIDFGLDVAKRAKRS